MKRLSKIIFSFKAAKVFFTLEQNIRLVRKLKNIELSRISVSEFKSIAKTPVIIVLDNVRSLHNIGSIFRTADAFVMEGIFLCGISACPPNPEIHKTALGSTESVHWQYFSDSMEAVKKLRGDGYTIVGIEQVEGSSSLEKMKFNKDLRYAFVLGNEVKGVDQTIINFCDFCIEIPQLGTKHSLNVSISGGVIMWEFFKQFHYE